MSKIFIRFAIIFLLAASEGYADQEVKGSKILDGVYLRDVYFNARIESVTCPFCIYDSGELADTWSEKTLSYFSLVSGKKDISALLDIATMRLDGHAGEIYRCIILNKGRPILKNLEESRSGNRFCINALDKLNKNYEESVSDGRLGKLIDVNAVCRDSSTYNAEINILIAHVQAGESCLIE